MTATNAGGVPERLRGLYNSRLEVLYNNAVEHGVDPNNVFANLKPVPLMPAK